MADNFLSQEEVDALLKGVNGDQDDAVAPEEATGVRTYNLATQERIVRGRMPTLEIINERFARYLRVGLFNFLRRSAEVSVGSVRVSKYSECSSRTDTRNGRSRNHSTRTDPGPAPWAGWSRNVWKATRQ